MPTVYIDTDNVAAGRDGSIGNPYNSWDEAWEAEDANIDKGESWLFLFEGTTEDTSPVVIDGYPTAGGSGDVTLDFEPQSTADGAYDGDDNYSPLHYRLSASSSPTIEISGDNETTDGRTVKIEHLQIGNTTAANANIISIVSGASGNIDILRNRFKPASTGNFPRAVRVDGGVTSAHTVRFINNLVPYADVDNLSTLNLNDALATAIAYNNTLYYSDISGGEDAIDDVTGVTTTAKNNVCFAAGGGGFIEFDIAGTITKDYNAHSSSADRGANGLAVATGDFTDAGTADTNELTPAASQTNAWATAGITNGDDANVPTVDIRGNARNVGSGENTAIGCFAASGEGSTGVTVLATGVSGTASIGDETVPNDVALATGVSGTGAVGSVTVDVGLTIVEPTGLSATGAIGDEAVIGAAIIAATGLNATGAIGDETVNLATIISPTGLEGISALGDETVVTNSILSVTGWGAIAGLGDETVTGGTVVAPTGVSASGSIGSTTVSISGILVTGLGASASIGSPTIISAETVAVSGLGAIMGLGSLSIQIGGEWSDVSQGGPASWVNVSGGSGSWVGVSNSGSTWTDVET